jgi:hypothetical protein
MLRGFRILPVRTPFRWFSPARPATSRTLARAARLLRPDAGPAAFLARRLIWTARHRIHEALQVRRDGLRSIIAASLIPCGAITLLAVSQDPRVVFGETAYGAAPTAFLFAGAVGFVSIVGVLSALRETAALDALRRAAAPLSPEQAACLAGEVRQLPEEEHREILAVLRASAGEWPAELVPAAAPGGSGQEVAADPSLSHRAGVEQSGGEVAGQS